jgi:hypothetical protein
LLFAVVSSAVIASCDDEHEDNGKRCDDYESFHQVGPMSSTIIKASRVADRSSFGAPVRLLVEHAPTITVEPAAKDWIVIVVTSDAVCAADGVWMMLTA